MDKGFFFDRNLLALSQGNGELCSRLQGAMTTLNRYKFPESRSGELIPAWVDSSGAAHPLHSIMDPMREAKRLIGSVESGSFIVLLGLGGAYYAEAALERNDIGMVVVIDYDINGIAELLCHRNYAALFGDPRFRLLLDLSPDELERQILSLYQPVLHGGIRVIPLRARTSLDAETFAPAGRAIESALDRVSADYSVQAHFGARWFSNIIRNLKPAGEFQEPLPPKRKIAISAAGPSLTLQTKQLRERRTGFYLIAADTSLPCLLDEGITPDAVISIDCQHISYYHFMDGLPEDVLLFLDLASPPLLASHFRKHMFFTGGHPLTRYISRTWKALPELDTSGGNVTYAAISLAEQLGAREIELYGADFSYPSGASYARGAYIYSYFGKLQNRFSPLESQNSKFLFRSPLDKKQRSGGSWYYETKALKFYREKLEEKCESMEAAFNPIQGMGAPIKARPELKNTQKLKMFSSGIASMPAKDFLLQYMAGISALPDGEKSAAAYTASLKGEAQNIFTTLLPVAATLKRCNPQWDFRELVENTKSLCREKIGIVLSQSF